MLNLRRSTVLVALTSVSLLTGCTSYYKVTDPTSGKTYYTTEIREAKKGGTQLTDARTKAKVTIQNSEITKISQSDFKAAIKSE